MTLAVLACLYLFRAPLLRSGALALVVDQPRKATTALLLLDADHGPTRAAECYREGRTRSVLLIEEWPGRVVRMGVLPPREDVLRRSLGAEGLPEEAVTVLAGRAGNDWDRARRLREWLAAHPGATVTVLCDRFGSRRLYRVFGTTLGAEAARLRWWAPADRRFDENDWWRHKEGFLQLFSAGAGLGYVWLVGEDREEWRAWDPDRYEKGLR
ncbi:MAG TPA: hypothetical protein VFE78_35205 [Gemmataceae bacterium]|jgi:hypothetical protein|nr:hypothetical protein [Gemmataceae bacterium]